MTRTAAARLGRHYRTLTALAALADFFFGATYVVHMRQAGLAPAIIGTLLAAAGLLSFALEVPTGIFADRIGNKRVLVYGLLTWGAAQAAFGWASTTTAIAVSLMLMNVGLALYSGAPVSYVMNALGRGGGDGAHSHGDDGDRIRAGGGTGSGAGAVPGASTVIGSARATEPHAGSVPQADPQVDAGDQRGAVARSGNTWRWIGACTGGATAFAWGRQLGIGSGLTASGALLMIAALWVALRWEAEPPPENATLPAAHHLSLSARTGADFLRTPDGRRLCLAYAGLGLGQGVLVLLWQPRLTDMGLVSVDALGLVLTVLMLGAAAGSAASRVLDRLPRIAVSCSIAIIAVGLAVSMLDGPVALLGFMIAESGVGAAGAVASAHGQLLFEDDRRNTLTSLTTAIMTVAITTAQFLIGLLWDRWGVVAATGAGAATVFAAALACAVTAGPRAALAAGVRGTPAAEPTTGT